MSLEHIRSALTWYKQLKSVLHVPRGEGEGTAGNGCSGSPSSSNLIRSKPNIDGPSDSCSESRPPSRSHSQEPTESSRPSWHAEVTDVHNTGFTSTKVGSARPLAIEPLRGSQSAQSADSVAFQLQTHTHSQQVLADSQVMDDPDHDTQGLAGVGVQPALERQDIRPKDLPPELFLDTADPDLQQLFGNVAADYFEADLQPDPPSRLFLTADELDTTFGSVQPIPIEGSTRGHVAAPEYEGSRADGHVSAGHHEVQERRSTQDGLDLKAVETPGNEKAALLETKNGSFRDLGRCIGTVATDSDGAVAHCEHSNTPRHTLLEDFKHRRWRWCHADDVLAGSFEASPRWQIHNSGCSWTAWESSLEYFNGRASCMGGDARRDGEHSDALSVHADAILHVESDNRAVPARHETVAAGHLERYRRASQIHSCAGHLVDVSGVCSGEDGPLSSGEQGGGGLADGPQESAVFVQSNGSHSTFRQGHAPDATMSLGFWDRIASSQAAPFRPVADTLWATLEHVGAADNAALALVQVAHRETPGVNLMKCSTVYVLQVCACLPGGSLDFTVQPMLHSRG
jgi:hypothetical protein